MLVVELGVSADNVRNYLAMCGVTRENFLDGDLAVESRGPTGCAVHIGETAPTSVGIAVSHLSEEIDG